MKYYRHRSSGAIKAVKTINEFSMPSNWERVHVLPDWTPNTPETRPPVGEVVIIFKPDVLTWKIDTDRWMCEAFGWDGSMDAETTHWMPCPDLPEDDKPEPDKPERIEKIGRFEDYCDDAIGISDAFHIKLAKAVDALIDKVEGEK